MKAQYRLINFVPDPFHGNRYSVGAVVRDEQGIQVAMAKFIPQAECLGSDQSFMLLRQNLGMLRQLRSFEEMPLSFGPHFVMGKPQVVDSTVRDVVAWLRDEVLPQPLGKKSTARKRGPNRSTMGRRYLSQFGVSDYIRPFKATRELPVLNGTASIFPSFSQAVSSKEELFFLEPIALSLKSVEEHAKEVTRDFSASRDLLRHKNVGKEIRRYAYLLPDGNLDLRQELKEMLALGADEVVDTMSLAERESFVKQIDRVGSRGASQGTMV